MLPHLKFQIPRRGAAKGMMMTVYLVYAFPVELVRLDELGLNPKFVMRLLYRLCEDIPGGVANAAYSAEVHRIYSPTRICFLVADNGMYRRFHAQVHSSQIYVGDQYFNLPQTLVPLIDTFVRTHKPRTVEANEWLRICDGLGVTIKTSHTTSSLPPCLSFQRSGY